MLGQVLGMVEFGVWKEELIEVTYGKQADKQKNQLSLSTAHEAQLVNYLKATAFEVGLLLNFGQKPEHKRKVFGNQKRDLLSVQFDP